MRWEIPAGEASSSSSDNDLVALTLRETPNILVLEHQLQQLCLDISSYAAAHPHVTGVDKLLRKAQREVRVSCKSKTEGCVIVTHTDARRSLTLNA